MTTASRRRLQALATTALSTLTVVAVIGLQRLFATTDFLAPTVAVAVAAHALAAAGRRLGLRWWIATGLTLGLLLVAIVTARYGSLVPPRLPDGGTVDRILTDLADAATLFVDEGAPAPSAPGYLLIVMTATAVVAVLADGLAFRLHAPVEAVAPATGVFVFATVLSGPHQRVLSGALFLAAVLAYGLAQRALGQATRGGWLPSQLGRGSGAVGRAGAVAASLAVLGALVLAPALPGWGQPALVDLGPGGDGGDRITLSPLIDIRSRLVDQSERIAFTVAADRPAYWRLTSLDHFDGRIWTSSGRYTDVSEALPPAGERNQRGPASLNRQEFSIGALSAIWLPAASVPRRFSSEDAVDWDQASATLVVDPGRDSADDLDYVVESQDATPDGASVTDPDVRAAMLAVPEGFSPKAGRLAARVTAGAETPRAAARALQDFFRDDFSYSLDVAPGHSSADIESFLEQRIGYCEQFAGAYAAMARSIGLPARVAVGFTPGDEDPTAPGTYVVRGAHAHAWPEVLLPGQGWAAFEPTPGRGAPGARRLTGVAAQQADTGFGGGPGATPEPASDPAPRAPDEEPGPADTDLAAGRAEEPTGAWWHGPVLALAVLATLWVGALTVATRIDRARRRRRFGSVAAAWVRTEDALARAGVARGAGESTVAFASRARAAIPVAGDDHAALARRMSAVEWAPDPSVRGPDPAAEAASVVAAARRVSGPWRWMLTALSPGRLRRP